MQLHKTTIRLPKNLYVKAKKTAITQGTTLQGLITSSLQEAVNYPVSANKSITADINTSPFIGLHKAKNGQEWKNKSSAKIASELRGKSWYGK